MTKKDLRIVLLSGTDKSDLCQSLVQQGENIAAVLLPHASSRETRLLPLIQWAKEHGIPLFRPTHRDLGSELREFAPDVLLSAGYPYLLTLEDLNIASYNLNVHPTLLPRYRGAATAWHIIAFGEKESGVTVHFVDQGMDTGPILAQLRIDVTPFDTVRSLMRKTNALEPLAVKLALSELRAGNTRGTPQNEDLASTYTEVRKPEDSAVDPHRTLLELYDFIRACDPDRFPAFFQVDGQPVGIRLFRLKRPRGETDML